MAEITKACLIFTELILLPDPSVYDSTAISLALSIFDHLLFLCNHTHTVAEADNEKKVCHVSFL